MERAEFIANYREAFGEAAELPVAFWYSDEPIAATPRIEGCFFRELRAVRDGRPASLCADNVGCGGGRFYTGFGALSPRTPAFVSLDERYKQTPEMVVDHIERSGVVTAAGKYLNLVRIDRLGEFDRPSVVDRVQRSGKPGGFDGVEWLVFFATPDTLSGLVSWAWFDNNADDAVTTRFGSGCSTIVTDPAGENRRGGSRTFIGCFDVSVRPHLEADVLSFAVPMSRFREMCRTMRSTSLYGTRAWARVLVRIGAGCDPDELR